MRPRVCRLEQEAVRHPLCKVRLQSVIDRRSGVIENFGVQKSIVVDRIEGQTARLSAKPKIVELQRRWSAVVRVRLGAESFKLCYQSRLWRGAGHQTKQPGSLRSYVIRFQEQATSQITLNPKIPAR